MEESYLFYRNIWIDNFLDGDEQMKLLELLDSADKDLIVSIVQRLTLANIGLVHRAVKEFSKHNNNIPY